MLSHLEYLETMDALMVALSGLAMVFLVLGCLALLIQINAKIITGIEANKPVPPPAPVKAAAAPVTAQDDEELIAVLMAAIAEETQCDPGSFQITSVTPKN